MRVIRRAHFELSVDSFLVPIATGRTSLAERADSEVQKSQQCGQAERLAHRDGMPLNLCPRRPHREDRPDTPSAPASGTLAASSRRAAGRTICAGSGR